MTDQEPTGAAAEEAVEAPFDQVPRPEPAGAAARPSPLVLVAGGGLLATSGLGIGLLVALLFGGVPAGLRPAPDPAAEAPAVSLADSENTPQEEQEEPPSHLHVLEVARRAYEQGDLETARWIAASFLLRIDGLPPEERERESEALTLLADVLRADYTASLQAAGGGEGR